ncbi:MAG TPA: ferric reductase-like transmembrane domain-containing protein [Candidatus Nanoarchaeia archaeon]|nr:ferric reductase-like transmembrane domain-containing protein [Candidatus Nanoarchaeia archaeon]
MNPEKLTWWQRNQSKLGPWLLLILALIPFAAWLRFIFATSQESATLYFAFSVAAKLCSLTGMTLFALSFVLSTRWRFLEDWFGGLNRVYIWHHIVGGSSLVLILFHPIFLALRASLTSWNKAASLLLPHFTGSLLGFRWVVTYGIFALLLMIGLLFITFFVRLPYKWWLFTHKFMGVAFVLAGLHVLFIPSVFGHDPFVQNYLRAVIALGLISYVYYTLAGRILIRRYRYKVDEVGTPAEKVVQVHLAPLSRAMSFTAGQFAFIRFHQHGIATEWHPFSISSPPGADGDFRLTVKALGDFTTQLQGIKKGATAEVEGAFGKFSYTNYGNPNQIWVAGGIGVTPFLAMANSLPDVPHHIDFFYCVTDPAELIDMEEVKKAVNTDKHQFAATSHVAKEKGNITAEIIAKQCGGLDGKDIFLCGPPPMMKALRVQFKAAGVSTDRIHSEEFAMV